jgi:hypothetical protein
MSRIGENLNGKISFAPAKSYENLSFLKAGKKQFSDLQQITPAYPVKLLMSNLIYS